MSSTATTTHRRSWRTCWACAVLTALCAPRAIAQDAARQPQVQTAPRPSRSIESWAASMLPSHEQLKKIEIDAEVLLCIDRLGDSTYATREEAMVELLNGSFVKDQIYAALVKLRLTSEQRHRLLVVVQDRLLATPRGAVGIQVNPRLRPGKIIVERLLPDLPARNVLEKGDCITHLNGKPLASWNEFVEEVQTRAPGSKITVTVERVVSGRRPNRLAVAAHEPKFKTMEVEIELGSAEMLRDPVSGKVQKGGEVYQRLAAEAAAAARAFGPQPRQIQLVE